LFASAFCFSFVLSLRGLPAPPPFLPDLLGEDEREPAGVDATELEGEEGAGVATSIRGSSSSLRCSSEGGDPAVRERDVARFSASCRRSWGGDIIFGGEKEQKLSLKRLKVLSGCTLEVDFDVATASG